MAEEGRRKKKSSGLSTSLITDTSEGEGGPTEVTLECQAPGAREGTAAARPGAGTHGDIHSPGPLPLPPACAAPGSKQNSVLSRACTELTVIIGRCAAGFWVSIHRGLMKTGCSAAASV